VLKVRLGIWIIKRIKGHFRLDKKKSTTLIKQIKKGPTLKKKKNKGLKKQKKKMYRCKKESVGCGPKAIWGVFRAKN